MFGEGEGLPAAFFELVKLGFFQAISERREFGVGIRALVLQTLRAGHYFAERGDFGTKLVQFERGGCLINE